jgi:hypothetical protein
MKKRHFLKLFRAAWDKSFTEENILKAFAKPGIWPLKPEIVLSIITRPVTPPPVIDSTQSIEEVKTPKSAKSIRYF